MPFWRRCNCCQGSRSRKGEERGSYAEQTNSRRVASDLRMPRCHLGSSWLPAALLACQTEIFNTCAINYCLRGGSAAVTQEDVGRAG